MIPDTTPETRLAHAALQRLGTENPGTTAPTKQNSTAFNTHKNRPPVSRISGRLSNVASGRRISFTASKTKAATTTGIHP
jgi:hypothetical protein